MALAASLKWAAAPLKSAAAGGRGSRAAEAGRRSGRLSARAPSESMLGRVEIVDHDGEPPAELAGCGGVCVCRGGGGVGGRPVCGPAVVPSRGSLGACVCGRDIPFSFTESVILRCLTFIFEW